MIKAIVLLFGLGISLIQIVDAQVKDEQKIIQNLNKAEIVVVVEVLDIGKEPGFWSGLFPAYQTVHYKIVEVLKGSEKRDTIFVGHPVVKNSQTADKIKPKLSADIFSKENRLILFLNENKNKDCKNTGEYQTFDENLGVLIANDEILKIVHKNQSNN